MLLFQSSTSHRLVGGISDSFSLRNNESRKLIIAHIYRLCFRQLLHNSVQCFPRHFNDLNKVFLLIIKKS